jgi:hypothetical protein
VTRPLKHIGVQPDKTGGQKIRGQVTPFVPLRAVFYFGLSLAAFSFAASPAWAQFYVRSPEVKKGVAEIEEHGAFYSGPGEDERLWQTHELEGKYERNASR